MNPHLSNYLAHARAEELRRQAADHQRVALARGQRSSLPAMMRRAVGRLRGTAPTRPQSAEPSHGTDVRIRDAHQDDGAAVRRLAELDSAEVPVPPVLLAEIDGQLRAVVSLVGSGVIADPFHPTVALVELLCVRAAQLAAPAAATRSPRSVSPRRPSPLRAGGEER
jgi:hypothetical protein